MSIWDLDNYTDAVSSVVDTIGDGLKVIGDAGHEIGAVLKSIAPILSVIPGLGTAFGVAVYAAGALSAADKIDDALIGTASAAMPPGIPRIAFDGGVQITQDIAKGKNVWEASVTACRKTAQEAGGAKAVAAFDAGLAVAKGGKIDERVIAEGRNYALTGGGQSAAAAFDAGVGIAKGEGADQVFLDVSRGYIRDQGGPTAAAGFDAGVALGYGKTLQEAGWIALHSYAKGNDPLEQTLNFVKKVGEAKNLNMVWEDFLDFDLTRDFVHAYTEKAQGMATDFANTQANNLLDAVTNSDAANTVKAQLQPYMDYIKQNPDLLDWPAGQLAKSWKVDEVLIRAAQAVMRDPKHPDEQLLHTLQAGMPKTKQTVTLQGTTIQSLSALDAPGMGAVNSSRKKTGIAIIATNPELQRVYKLPTYPPQKLTDIPWQRGFAIAVAVTGGATGMNANITAARDALQFDSQINGFNAGCTTCFEINKQKELVANMGQMAFIAAAEIRAKKIKAAAEEAAAKLKTVTVAKPIPRPSSEPITLKSTPPVKLGLLQRIFAFLY